MAEMTKAFLTSESQTWATPWSVIFGLKPEFNFTLDVCAGLKSAKAPKFYTEADDAFKQPWAKDAAGGDAWCNPPYALYNGRRVEDWVQMGWSYRARLTSVFLLPCNKQDQDWYHDLVVPHGQHRPVRGRIPFVDPETGLPPKKLIWNKKKTKQIWVANGNSQGSMIIVFGPAYGPGPAVSFDFKKVRAEYKKSIGKTFEPLGKK